MAHLTPMITTDDIVAGMHILSNDLTDAPGFTLTSIGHNEMFFLPSFLAHYRALGVTRFVFIDDASDDGSRAYLAQQPDVMVLGSKHRFGDLITSSDTVMGTLKAERRAGLFWRTYLMDHFATDQWSVHVDMDEYIHLPEGMTFPQLTKNLDPQEAEVVWAVMLEAVPASITDMVAAQNDTELDLSKDWYFDGRPHLKLADAGLPVRVYGGLMSRLFTQYGLIKPGSWKRRLKWWLRQEPDFFNALQKPSLLYWRAGDIFQSHHKTAKPCFHDKLLPILHFKFAGSLYSKLAFAIESGAYNKGSHKYIMIEKLLASMVRKRASFLGRSSVKVTGFEPLARTGNAHGLQSDPPV